MEGWQSKGTVQWILFSLTFLSWNFAGGRVASSTNSTDHGEDLGDHDPSLNSSCKNENIEISRCRWCLCRNRHNAICCRGRRLNCRQDKQDRSRISPKRRRLVSCALIFVVAELICGFISNCVKQRLSCRHFDVKVFNVSKEVSKVRRFCSLVSKPSNMPFPTDWCNIAKRSSCMIFMRKLRPGKPITNSRQKKSEQR